MTRRRTPEDIRDNIKADLVRRANAQRELETLETIASRHGVSRALVVQIQREIKE